MLLTKIVGTKEHLTSLGALGIHVHRCGVRRRPGQRVEITTAIAEDVVPLLAAGGYEFSIHGDVTETLSQRLAPARAGALPGSGQALFNSLAVNDTYLQTAFLEQWIVNLADLFPDFCSVVPLPHRTWEGRVPLAVRLHAGDADHRLCILFISGVHAAEMGGPDACLYFLYRLINAYLTNSPIVLGKTSFSEHHLRDLVDHLDLLVVPCVNPDGRAYVEATKNWWRKNRNPSVGAGAIGVDINRNYDFLWSSGVGSSPDPNADTYRGAAPFSEPESRNVQWLLGAYRPDLFIDIHGPSETLVYSWGDALNQSVDPSMSFQNPAWNGKRRSPYREYLPPGEGKLLQQLGATMVDAANAVWGAEYVCAQSCDLLYATTGTSDDYAYSLHFIDSAWQKSYAYTLEYGGGSFFPPYTDMLPIIDEVNAAMLQLCDVVIAPV